VPLRLKKNIPDILDRNLKTNYQILITFGTNVSDKWLFSFSLHPTFVSALPGENTKSEISLFYPMRYNCLINITHKNTFCSHFWHFGWHFIQLSIFQLPAVKLLEVLAHYANAGKRCFLHSLTAVSIMFYSKPIQAVPVEEPTTESAQNFKTTPQHKFWQ